MIIKVNLRESIILFNLVIYYYFRFYVIILSAWRYLNWGVYLKKFLLFPQETTQLIFDLNFYFVYM